MSVYKVLSRIAPKRYRNSLESLIKYADLKVLPERWIGFSLFYSLALGFSIGFALLVLFKLSNIIFLGLSLSIFAALQLVSYTILVLAVDRRATFSEKVLPDALQLMAANIRAGMTPDRALLIAAKPEFGPLEIAIKHAATEALSGTPLTQALKDISRDIRSTVLERTVRLIIEGVRSGGELAKLLEETAYDIRQSEILRKEVRSNVMMYVIFIFIAVGIGSPLLYAISSFLVESLSKIGAGIVLPPEAAKAGPFSLQIGTSLSPEFLLYYSLLGILISAIFGSLIIGEVESGEAKRGTKYLPMLLGIALSVFFIVRFLISNILGTFVG